MTTTFGKITIVVRGKTESDAKDAFDEAVERLSNGLCLRQGW